MDDVTTLAKEIKANRALIKGLQEANAEYERRLIELLYHDFNQEGQKTYDYGDLIIKVGVRMNRKVDSELLLEIAREKNMMHNLNALFRWKPEINMKAWKNTSAEITRELLPAITTKCGKPTITIEDAE